MERHSKTRIVTIHQPQYLPWIPYFDKILQSDVFVILDTVQYQQNGLQNRNKINGPNGPMWLTVPVKKRFGQSICDVQIADIGFSDKHLKTLKMNYKRAPYFESIFPEIQGCLRVPYTHLSDLCCKLLETVLSLLNYGGVVYKNTDLRIDGKKSELVLNICNAMSANVYYSGIGGFNYLDVVKFKDSGIQVEFQAYRNVPYRQCFEPASFIPGLSIIDLLFNVGNDSAKVIRDGRVVDLGEKYKEK